MKSSVPGTGNREFFLLGGKGSLKDKLPLAYSFPLLAATLALLLGAVLGTRSPVYSAVAICFMLIAVLILLRQDELAITAVIGVHLYVDWYLGLHLIGLAMALALLFIYFLGRSSRHPWVELRPLWLWVLFLILAIYPSIYGAFLLYDAASFYPGNVLGALLLYWLGSIIAKDMFSVRRFFQILACFSALLALHTIIQAATGTVLFESENINTYLAGVSNYQLAGSTAFRSGSFFIDPNWNGTFFSIVFFLPLGLFLESTSLLGKLVSLAEMLLILPALLFTYSNGAWIGTFAGVVAFVLIVGRTRYRVAFPFFILALGVVMVVAFPEQIALQLQHATGSDELSLRIGAWQTALNVIAAFPLFGVGLGYQAYFERANPYRDPAQFVPLSHPHNSYLEWGAMAGLPVLAVFLALLVCTFWLAWRNWQKATIHVRPLLAGGLSAVIALSVNSLSINGWTLPPLAALGWLILGILSSPLLTKNLLTKSQHREFMQKT